jgi:hypothetical protein
MESSVGGVRLFRKSYPNGRLFLGNKSVSSVACLFVALEHRLRIHAEGSHQYMDILRWPVRDVANRAYLATHTYRTILAESRSSVGLGFFAPTFPVPNLQRQYEPKVCGLRRGGVLTARSCDAEFSHHVPGMRGS